MGEELDSRQSAKNMSIENMTENERYIYNQLTQSAMLQKELDTLSQLAEIPLTNVTNSGIKGLIQKIMKKLIDWYMDPIVTRQTAYNRQLIQVLKLMEQDR